MTPSTEELDDELHVRMNSDLKESVDDLIRSVGLNHATVVRMLYKRIVADQGIPFDLRIPNETTREALETEDVDETTLESEDEVDEHLEDFVDDL